MRASKEQAEKALHQLHKLVRAARQYLNLVGLKKEKAAARHAWITMREKELKDFLIASRRKLPSEAAYDRDAQRKRGA